MDNYFGFREQVKNYYLEMALAESYELNRLATRASAFYLKNAQTRLSFRKEIDDLVNRHISACRSATTQEGQRNSFVCLKAESNSLRTQYESLQINKFSKAVYLEIKKENGYITYIIKGIGLIAGLSQVIAGIPMVFGSTVTGVSASLGVLLIAHGSNNIYENGQYFFTGEERTGLLRDLYRYASSNAGYSNNTADIIYAGVDLSLSANILFGKVAISSPNSLLGSTGRVDTGRLYRAINSDMVTGFKTMGKFSLFVELSGDAVTISGMFK